MHEALPAFFAPFDIASEVGVVSDVSTVAVAHSLISDKINEARIESSELCDSFLASDVAETKEARYGSACTSSESIGSFLAFGVAETELLSSDEPEKARYGSACTTEHGENLVRDP